MRAPTNRVRSCSLSREKIAATRRFADQVVPWLERGVVRPVVDSVFPIEEVQAAQKKLESNQVFGKVILRM